MIKNIFKNNFFVNIPSDVNFIYLRQKKILAIISSTHLKLLKLNIQIFINKKKKFIIISDLPFVQLSKNDTKKLLIFQKTDKILIKQNILEVSAVLYKKLKLTGVGLRVFNIDKFNYKLLLFKLGYSHFIYFKITKEINVFNFKMTILFFSSYSFKNLIQMLSKIRLFKKPDPYKGKGILYSSEKLILKKRKKI
jgi:large subunit ribosomal protein L6